MDLETRQVLNPKFLKLINFLRNIVSNIEIEGFHQIDEKDEKLENLHFGGGSGSGWKISAVCMTPCPSTGRSPLKKHLSNPSVVARCPMLRWHRAERLRPTR